MEFLVQQLTFPFKEKEPDIQGADLETLDRIAEAVEISRLQSKGVLLPAKSIDAATAKRLLTRFVHTWQDKVVDGARVWLRRARYVAKEFAWLAPDRQDLFSPASSNVTCRLLPTLFSLPRQILCHGSN